MIRKRYTPNQKAAIVLELLKGEETLPQPYQPAPPSAEELALKRRIEALYTAYPFCGSRKIAVVLGLKRKLIQRHMRAMGIAGLVPGPNTSQQATNPAGPILAAVIVAAIDLAGPLPGAHS